MSDKSINELHAAIMNLPCDGATLDWANTREAYMYGHRYARRAAAELVAAYGAASPSAPEAQGEPMTMAHAAQIKGALDAMQEMWDHLRHKGLNDILMLEYSNALKVLEDDFISRLPIDAALSSHGDKGGSNG